ncbi:MAG: FAD:protein FMN transferase [Acidimicrobiales bacterium]
MSTTTADPSRRSGATIYRTTRWSTSIDLLVTERSALVGAVELLDRELDVVEAVASRFRPDSEINLLHDAIARAGGQPVPISPLLAEAIGIGLRAGALTGGAVDITVGAALARLGYDRDFPLLASGIEGSLPEPRPLPGWQCVTLDLESSTVAAPPGVVLDLGATAKAWAADRAARAVGSTFGCGVLVSLGGDMAVSGAPDGGFTVGVADVCDADEAAVAVAIASGGLASSGIGRRNWLLGGHRVHHLIDPATALPAQSPWRTVSVAAACCIDANTASTAAMVTGKSAVDWLTEAGLPSRLVCHDGSVLTVAGWPLSADEVIR